METFYCDSRGGPASCMTVWNHIKCQVMLSSIRFVSKATVMKPLSVRRYYVTANYISAITSCGNKNSSLSACQKSGLAFLVFLLRTVCFPPWFKFLLKVVACISLYVSTFKKQDKHYGQVTHVPWKKVTEKACCSLVCIWAQITRMTILANTHPPLPDPHLCHLPLNNKRQFGLREICL